MVYFTLENYHIVRQGSEVGAVGVAAHSYIAQERKCDTKRKVKT